MKKTTQCTLLIRQALALEQGIIWACGEMNSKNQPEPDKMFRLTKGTQETVK
jgi:hypothetical protein